MRFILCSLFTASLLAPASLAQDEPGPFTVELRADLRRFDTEGSRARGMMSMPSAFRVGPDRPAIVKKEPSFSGAVKYATLVMGNAGNTGFVVALDESDPSAPKIYADLNGNGDLTDDGPVSWQTIDEGESGWSYSGTYEFSVGYSSAAGEISRRPYALNLFRSAGRESLGAYRATAMVGSVTRNGETLDVVLLENDNDGLYNKPVDPAAKEPPATKPVWLMIGKERFDIRATFGYDGVNYLASAAPDGSSITLKPTMKTITIPRPAAPKPPLGVGVQVPAFEAKFSDGTSFSPDQYRGKKILVIDMWATWCGPCMQSMPHLGEVAAKVKGQEVEIVALNVLDEEEPYLAYVQKNQDVAFRIARDPAGREREAAVTKRLFNVSGIPMTYVVDKDGKIAAAIEGYSKGDSRLEEALAKLGVKIEVPAASEKPKPKSVPAVKMGG